MTKYRLEIGKNGEIVANKFLKKRGFSILEKNYNTPFGEIDIIAKNGNTIIFFEVKTRTSQEYGTPLEAIDMRKRKHIIKSCMYYLRKYHQEDIACRIDAIGITLGDEGNLEILRHVRNAIEMDN